MPRDDDRRRPARAPRLERGRRGSAPAQDERRLGRLPAVALAGSVALIAASGGGSGSDGGDDGRPAPAVSSDGTQAAGSTQAPPDRGRIVFRRWSDPAQTRGEIFTIAPDGSDERQLPSPPARSSDDYPDFASDGSLIAFQRCDERQTCRILTVLPDGTALRRVGGCRPVGAAPRCTSMSYPAIAPTDGRIAFVRASRSEQDDEYTRQGIFTMRMDGTGLRRVTLPGAGIARDDEPQWSPDGRRLVFVRVNGTARPAGGQAIFTVRTDGSDLQRITPWDLRAGDGPNWSPDGARVLFRSNESEEFTNSNLFTVGSDGSGVEQITHVAPTTRLYSSGFSPDGKSITFGMQGTDDAADVFTMDVDGTGLTPVTRTSLGDSAPDWGDAPE